MAERWVLTPTNGRPIVLPHSPKLGGCIVTEVQTPAPPLRNQWAPRREGASASVREYENRDVTLKVQLFRPTDEWWGYTHDHASATVVGHAPEAEGDGDLPGWTGTIRRAAVDGNPVTPAIADLSKTVAQLAASGGRLRRVLNDGTAYSFTVQSAEMSEPPAWDLTYYLAHATTLTLRMICSPFAFGDEAVLATRLKSGGSRLFTINDLQVPGDVPALARVVLGNSPADQQSLLLAVDQPAPATAAVGVELPAAARPGGATTTTVAAAGTMPDSVAATVRRAPASANGTPAGLWEPVSYLRDVSGVPLTVAGSYRVFVRLSSPAGTTLRLRYATGSAAAGLADNGSVTVGATAGAALVDLGTITIPAGGTLDGVLERQTPGTELFVDRWLLIPTDRYTTAGANTALGPLEITAVDGFARTGQLPGSTAPQGGTWVGRGDTPFATDGTSAWRLAGTDSGAASTLPVATGPITLAVSCRCQQAATDGERGAIIGNAEGITAVIAGSTPTAGAWAVATAVEWDTVSPAGGERIKTVTIAGGVRSISYHSAWREDWSRGHTFSLSVDGTVERSFMTWPGGSNDHTQTIAAMPTTGVEAGIYTIGVFMRSGGSDVAQRVDFDDFLVTTQPPPSDRALFKGRTAELSTTASTRVDVAYRDGPIARQGGDRPLLPPSGAAALPVRVVAGVGRQELRGGSDPVGTDDFTVLIAATPRYLQVPETSAPLMTHLLPSPNLLPSPDVLPH